MDTVPFGSLRRPQRRNSRPPLPPTEEAKRSHV
jgi:hypothetical protein